MDELFIDGVVAIDLTYDVCDFSTVGSYVLDCRRSCFARDI